MQIFFVVEFAGSGEKSLELLHLNQQSNWVLTFAD